jgi:hypothetical protein
VVRCPVCRITYVPNTLFCTECGLYLLKSQDLATDPLEAVHVKWRGETDDEPHRGRSVLDMGPLTVRLRISQGDQPRELEVRLTKPVRLGRMDPLHDIYPEVDLTEDMALDYGVSREHACIFRRGEHVLVEDLGSTNGTLLNGATARCSTAAASRPFSPITWKTATRSNWEGCSSKSASKSTNRRNPW